MQPKPPLFGRARTKTDWVSEQSRSAHQPLSRLRACSPPQRAAVAGGRVGSAASGAKCSRRLLPPAALCARHGEAHLQAIEGFVQQLARSREDEADVALRAGSKEARAAWDHCHAMVLRQPLGQRLRPLAQAGYIGEDHERALWCRASNARHPRQSRHGQIARGKPVHMQLRRVPDFSKEAIEAYAAANIKQGSWVVSDGLGCFRGVVDAGVNHLPIVTGGGRPRHPFFKWANTMIGNIKSAITGTCRSLDGQHTDRYLAAYEWRFNRRFDLARNVDRLTRAALATAPQPRSAIALVRRPAEMTG